MSNTSSPLPPTVNVYVPVCPREPAHHDGHIAVPFRNLANIYEGQTHVLRIVVDNNGDPVSISKERA